tara:strand:+ start:2218 stop:2841 length:624 start_codon:yes stop_codon:yes gene_type:complete
MISHLATASKELKMKQIINLCIILTLTACSSTNNNNLQPASLAEENSTQKSVLRVENATQENSLGVLTLEHQGTSYQSKVVLNVIGNDIIFEMETDEDTTSAEKQFSKQENLEIFDGLLDEEDLGKALRLLSSAQQLAVDKDYLEALTEVDKAISAAPRLAQAHALKGSVLYKMKKVSDAKVAWAQALEIDPSYKAVQKVLTRLDTK